MTHTAIQRAVMRRVYYSYGLSIVSHPMFWRGFFLGAAALLLARWLHVASIVNNFLSVPVGNVPQYVLGSVWGALTSGELLTVVTLVLAAGVALSAAYHIAQSLLHRLWFVSRV